MSKTILLTGATDGIGLQTAIALAKAGHNLVLHGRSAEKMAGAEAEVRKAHGDAAVTSILADLSVIAEAADLAEKIVRGHERLDVLINNAGVFKTANTTTADGIDTRFAVNTIAPYVLTRRLMSIMGADARVVNVSSAAQAPVTPQALEATGGADDMRAYAQSKLAITMWSHSLAQANGANGPSVIAVNPGSLLATKMVADAFGPSDKDVGIGVDILVRAALSDEFANASGKYFDNDLGRFANPHPDALDLENCQAIEQVVEAITHRLTA